MYIVKFNQWFRCGRNGDDTDYEEISVEFNTLPEATQYADEVAEGKYRGMYDRTVHRNEIKIVQKNA